MTHEFLDELKEQYNKEGLDFENALITWKNSKLTPSQIQAQIKFDIRRSISSTDSRALHRLGSSALDNYTTLPSVFEVSKGKEDLIPENIKDRQKIRLSPTTRMSLEKIGQNLYRDKIARYWTLKERTDGNGEKVVYLVAVDDDSIEKT